MLGLSSTQKSLLKWAYLLISLWAMLDISNNRVFIKVQEELHFAQLATETTRKKKSKVVVMVIVTVEEMVRCLTGKVQKLWATGKSSILLCS